MCGFVSFVSFFFFYSAKAQQVVNIVRPRLFISLAAHPWSEYLQFVKTTCCFFPEREVIFALLLSLFFRLPSQQQPCGERRAAVAKEPGCSHKLNSSSQSFQGGNVSLAHPTV